MGKLITLPSVQGLCPHKLSTHSAQQFFLGRSKDELVLDVMSHEVRSMRWTELKVIYCLSTVLGINGFLVENLLQYIFPEFFVLFSILLKSEELTLDRNHRQARRSTTLNMLQTKVRQTKSLENEVELWGVLTKFSSIDLRQRRGQFLFSTIYNLFLCARIELEQIGNLER
jgi:hypothetical protein